MKDQEASRRPPVDPAPLAGEAPPEGAPLLEVTTFVDFDSRERVAQVFGFVCGFFSARSPYCAASRIMMPLLACLACAFSPWASIGQAFGLRRFPFLGGHGFARSPS